jgi:hypothetical protein
MPRKSKKMPMANIYDRSLSNTWQLHRTIILLQKAEEMNRRKITHTTINNNTEKQKKKIKLMWVESSKGAALIVVGAVQTLYSSK